MTQAFNLSQFANKLNTSGQADLTTAVSGQLPIANGGTNSSATPTNGGIVYGTGTAMATTAAGTAGQLLYSNGASAPSWGAAPQSGFGNMVVITSTNPSYSIPATKLKVTVVGGGGNGGSAYSQGYNQQTGGGGGGGAGGTAIKIISGLSVGATVSVTVGGVGGTSSFGAYCSATGGGNGANGNNNVGGNGGAGGTGSSGDLNIGGGSGANATSGFVQGSASSQSGGFGGGSFMGGGGGSGGYTAAGKASTCYGGGGGGGGNGGGSGGAGFQGVVIVEY